MVLSLRYPPARVLAAVLCLAIMVVAGLAAANDVRSALAGSGSELLLATTRDKVAYWGGWGLAVAGTVALGVLAVTLAPATVVVTIGAVAVSAKTATAVATGAVVTGMALQAWGGRPQ